MMTSFRLAFLAAFCLLIVGVIAGRSWADSLFAAGDARAIDVAAAHARTATASPTPRPPSPRTPPATGTPPATATATATPTSTATAIPTSTPSTTPTPTATLPPTPTATAGIVQLARYWVGSQLARRGQTIAIGYVIDNATGHTEHLLLGASLKPATVPSWTTSINDTYHDVVAVVPPGITTHVRYFALPAGLRSGAYDVAWGLRDTATGERLALVAAASALTVTR